MFEQMLLERTRQKNGHWSWLGLLVQAGLVAAMVVVPMLHPEVIAVMAPKGGGQVIPLEPLAPQLAQPSQPANSAPAPQDALRISRPRARVFSAPARYDRPVATIIDGPELSFQSLIGSPVSQASSGPYFPGQVGVIPVAPPPKPAAPPAVNVPARIRVGGQIRMANLLHRVNPIYPTLAKQARISGLVRLEGIIARDGTIQQLKVVSGHPSLAPAALEAVRQWRYEPTLLNGEPVEVIAPIDVNFILSH